MHDQHDLPMVLTPSQVSDYLQISKNKLYELLHSGELKSVCIGRLYRIPKEALFEYLEVK